MPPHGVILKHSPIKRKLKPVWIRRNPRGLRKTVSLQIPCPTGCFTMACRFHDNCETLTERGGKSLKSLPIISFLATVIFWRGKITKAVTRCDSVVDRALIPTTSWGTYFLGLVLFCSGMAVARGSDTNQLPAPPPQQLAARYEQTGHKREAAAIYEELVRTNSVARNVLGPRLVTIYTELGETNQALVWAREVRRGRVARAVRDYDETAPTPQVYLRTHRRHGCSLCRRASIPRSRLAIQCPQWHDSRCPGPAS